MATLGQRPSARYLTVYIGGLRVCVANDVFRPIDCPVRRGFAWPLDYAGGLP